jgi:hypothetical protein
MYRLTSILIVLGLAMQVSFKLAVCFNFTINRTKIVKEFCENKAKPAMKCNGKCHLKKILKVQDEDQQQGKPAVKENPDVQQNLPSKPEVFREQCDPVDLVTTYLLKKPGLFRFPVFHPPCA